MRYIEEFRNRQIISRLVKKLKGLKISLPLNFMEVCGTHTVSFFKFGIDKIIPSQIKIISGPGCPVCVSEEDFIDKAIYYAQNKEMVVVSFADMLRVPGTNSTLEKERAKGADIRLVYSVWQALEMAEENSAKKFLFLAVGFETTAPTVALTVLTAKKRKIKNLFFLLSLKRIPPVMEYLLRDKDLNLQGFICPGHVSAIIGVKPYGLMARKYKAGFCIAGFEPVDILTAIYVLAKQAVNKEFMVFNQYRRLVKEEGNLQAQKILKEVFLIDDVRWRGVGLIPQSGFKFKKFLEFFDIEKILPIPQKIRRKNNVCLCGEVIKGKVSPLECPLFSEKCNPRFPMGPCMVSMEGACHAYYRYQRKN